MFNQNKILFRIYVKPLRSNLWQIWQKKTNRKTWHLQHLWASSNLALACFISSPPKFMILRAKASLLIYWLTSDFPCPHPLTWQKSSNSTLCKRPETAWSMAWPYKMSQQFSSQKDVDKALVVQISYLLFHRLLQAAYTVGCGSKLTGQFFGDGKTTLLFIILFEG